MSTWRGPPIRGGGREGNVDSSGGAIWRVERTTTRTVPPSLIGTASVRRTRSSGEKVYSNRRPPRAVKNTALPRPHSNRALALVALPARRRSPPVAMPPAADASADDDASARAAASTDAPPGGPAVTTAPPPAAAAAAAAHPSSPDGDGASPDGGASPRRAPRGRRRSRSARWRCSSRTWARGTRACSATPAR